MKKSMIGKFGVCLFSMIVVATAGVKAQDKLDASVGADLVSAYEWRGQDLGGAAAQPYAGIAYKGLTLGAWGSIGLDKSIKDPQKPAYTSELDFTLGYTSGKFNVAVTDYYSLVNLNFGETITGNYYSKKTKKEKKINLQPTRPFVDFNWTDHLISTLPLDLGYKARIPQFYYNSDSDIFVEDYTIKEVKSYSYSSPKTGKHDSWLVTLLEESTGAIYNYVIDKKDRRLWQREMSMGNGKWEITVNEELDYQPIKNRFNKEQAAQQISQGNSVIIGTAYARSSSGKKLGGLVNTAKKQYAPKGTEITLFANSAYYEEWLEVNKKIRKQKKVQEVPLDPDFGYAIKKAKVYDDEGHFEFADLMPGAYVIMASFDFTNSYNYSYVSGYTNYYNYWGYTGSTTNYGTARSSYVDKANVEKHVTIDKDGEKKEVNLKEM